MRPGLLIFAAVAALAACDSSSIEYADEIVVQAVARTGEAVPDVRVHRTAPIGSGGSLPVDGASVGGSMGGHPLTFGSSDDPGMYVALAPAPLAAAGDTLRLWVEHTEHRASGSAVVPPAVRLLDVRVDVPDRAIETILLDSLSLPIDSLSLALPSRSGYIYPILVSIEWAASQSDHWIEARLDPVAPFSSTLIDFFLLTRGVLREAEAEPGTGPDRRRWDGVYAIPVDGPSEPLPAHELVVWLTRGDEAYARFALSSLDSDRREPAGNVVGGLGLVTAIAADSLRVHVR